MNADTCVSGLTCPEMGEGWRLVILPLTACVQATRECRLRGCNDIGGSGSGLELRFYWLNRSKLMKIASGSEQRQCALGRVRRRGFRSGDGVSSPHPFLGTHIERRGGSASSQAWLS